LTNYKDDTMKRN